MTLRDHCNKGNYFMARHCFSQALKEYEFCLDIDPMSQAAKDNIVLTHNNWGIDYFRQRNYEEARKEWEQALKLDSYNRNARNNLAVLKATLSKLQAQTAETAPESKAEGAKKPETKDKTEKSKAKEAKAKEEPQESAQSSGAVILLTPGFKQSQGAVTGGKEEAAASPASTPVGAQPASGAAPLMQGEVPNTAVPGLSNPASVPSQAGAGNSLGGGSSERNSKSRTDVTSAPAPPQAQLRYVTIEERLDAIETKIYGHKQENMPIIRRLEKVEIDTAGQVKPGTIQDRIESLQQSYGI